MKDLIERADALAAIALGDTVNQLQAKIRAIPRALAPASGVEALAALRAELHGAANMTYLLNAYGAPFSVAGLGNRFRKWCDEAGLDQKSLHGIRKGLSAMLAGQGATSTEIDVLLGHEMGSPETKVYVRSAERARLAEQVIGRVDAMVSAPRAIDITAPREARH